MSNLSKGTLVRFKKPSKAMYSGYGLRMYKANNFSAEEFFSQKDYDLNRVDWNGLKAFDDETVGVLVEDGGFHNIKHGAGTMYVKLLMREQLYWIATTHVESIG